MHQGKFETLNIDAGGDISALQYRPMQVGGTLAVANQTAIGILQNRPAATGRGAHVGYFGVMKAYAGGALSAGADVSVTTSGWFVGTSSGHVSVGKVLITAASGDLFSGVFNFINKWDGA